MKAVLPYAEVKAPPEPRPRVPVKERNAKRGGHRLPNNVNEPLRVYVRGLPCILSGLVDRNGLVHECTGRVVCCHSPTRGSGTPDDNHVFPGCDGIGGAHAQQEGRTKEFEYRWRLRLRPLMRRITSAFHRQLRGGEF